jgi:hypothetical protein
MSRFIERILVQLRGETLKLLLLAGVILLVWGTLAPVGTLIWWLSEGSEKIGLKNHQAKNLPKSNLRSINCYIIYLPGVGDFSANELTPGEEIFLDRLVKLHPNCVAVSDVFPYSVAKKNLGGQGLLAPLWRAAKSGDGWLENADILIKIRNLWRFAISADNRYAPVYNQGIASTIIERMNAVHPIQQSSEQPVKIILMGTSGGVQVGLGAASYLDKWLNTELTVVSIGGSFDGNTGFKAVNHVYHLQGNRDWVEDITSILFASRWPVTIGSPFNQARRQGRYTVINSGSHAHSGAEGYFGTAKVGKAEVTYVELTVQKVNQLPIWSENQKVTD